MKSKNIIEEGYFTGPTHPFKIKPNFSTLGSIIEISSNINGSQIAFTPDDSIRYLLGFKPKVIHEEQNLSDYPVDTLSFDNIFLESDIAQGMIFKGEKTGSIHNWKITVDPGYKHVEKLAGGVDWYIMESKDFISKNSVKFKMKIMIWFRLMDRALLLDCQIEKFDSSSINEKYIN